MVNKKFKSLFLLVTLGLGLTGCTQVQKELAPVVSTEQSVTEKDLANMDYNGQQQITVNDNNPGFPAEELTVRTPWEKYADLDGLNRVVEADALLNQSLMPKAKREPLVWNPTGWHNKKMPDGKFIYNRSHLIGYQFTGQNNNPKNLMTGTVSLNNPEMLVNEDTIAAYLKESPKHYVRYSVKPIYRGNELVARGVWMRAQSLTDQRIRLNTYIFNVQNGMKIDYATGYSQIVGGANEDSQSSQQSQLTQPEQEGKIWGNKRSKVYHVPGQATYKQQGNPENRVWFNSEQEAQNAGYRKASN
jgi:DNA-entry nuclease